MVYFIDECIECFDGFEVGPFKVLATGQLFPAYAREPYDWPRRELMLEDPAICPSVTRPQIETALQAAFDSLPPTEKAKYAHKLPSNLADQGTSLPRQPIVKPPKSIKAVQVGVAGDSSHCLSTLRQGTPIYHYLYQPDDMTAANVTATRQSGRGLPEFFRASEFAGREKTVDRWLIEDLIPKRKVTLLGGDGGTGKSLLALQIAASVATGSAWLDLQVEKGTAVFFTAEDERTDLSDRMIDIANQSGLPLTAYENLILSSYAGNDASLVDLDPKDKKQRDSAVLTEIERCLAEVRPKLLVLDTLGNLFPGNENDRAQVVAFIARLYRLAMHYDVAVLLLGHPSLSGLNSGMGSSGSTAWNNSVRQRLYLQRPTDVGGADDAGGADAGNRRTLTVKKSNYGPTQLELLMVWRDGVFEKVEEDVAVVDAAGVVIPRETLTEDLFVKLLDQMNSQNRTVSANPGKNFAPSVFAKDNEAKQAKLSAKELSSAMERLLKLGKIKQIKEGPPSKQRCRLVVVQTQLH